MINLLIRDNVPTVHIGFLSLVLDDKLMYLNKIETLLKCIVQCDIILSVINIMSCCCASECVFI